MVCEKMTITNREPFQKSIKRIQIQYLFNIYIFNISYQLVSFRMHTNIHRQGN